MVGVVCWVVQGICVLGFDVNGNQLAVGVDKVFVFSAGVLFDLFVEFVDVGGGDKGVVGGAGLDFLVSASVWGVGEGGGVACFTEFFGFVERGPLDGFVVVLGHVAVGVVGVGFVFIVDVGVDAVNCVGGVGSCLGGAVVVIIADVGFVGDVAVDVVLVVGAVVVGDASDGGTGGGGLGEAV